MRSVRALRTVLLLTSSLPSSSFCTLSLLFAILLYLSLTSSPLFLLLSRFLFPCRPFSLLSRFFSPFLPLFHPARLFASYYYCFLPRILFFRSRMLHSCHAPYHALITIYLLSYADLHSFSLSSLLPSSSQFNYLFYFFTNSFFFLPSSFSFFFCFLPVTVSS